MALELYRIDDRLIHGQVVVGWGQPLDLEGVPLFFRLQLLMKLRELRARQSDAGSQETRFMLP